MSASSEGLKTFTYQFGNLLGTGKYSLAGSISNAAEQQGNEEFKQVLTAVQTAVGAGESLSHAMARYPDVFDKSYVAAVRQGLTNGNLDEAMQRLAESL